MTVLGLAVFTVACAGSFLALTGRPPCVCVCVLPPVLNILLGVEATPREAVRQGEGRGR